jgi:hypothetical protein
VRICQKAPIFGAFGSEGDTCDLVGIRIPFHAPFAIFILDMSAGIRDAPSGPVGWGADRDILRERCPIDDLRLRLVNRFDLGGVVKLLQVEIVDIVIYLVRKKLTPPLTLSGVEIVDICRWINLP